MIICTPFMKVVCNVVTTRIRRSVLKVDDDILMVRRDVWWQLGIEVEQVSVLSVVVLGQRSSSHALTSKDYALPSRVIRLYPFPIHLDLVFDPVQPKRLHPCFPFASECTQRV